MMQKAVRNWMGTMENNVSKEENGNVIEPRFNIHKIDMVACAVSGVLFLLFNVVYWLTYMLFKFN